MDAHVTLPGLVSALRTMLFTLPVPSQSRPDGASTLAGAGQYAWRRCILIQQEVSPSNQSKIVCVEIPRRTSAATVFIHNRGSGKQGTVQSHAYSITHPLTLIWVVLRCSSLTDLRTQLAVAACRWCNRICRQVYTTTGLRVHE